MTLKDAVKKFIEYEEKGSMENWCEWDQHFQDLKKAYHDDEILALFLGVEDYKEER